MTTLILASLLALGPLGLSGCAHDKAALRNEEKEKADLSARSELFWRSLRWQDYDGAAAFVEDDEQRVSWKLVMESESKAVRWQDSSLLDLKVDPVLDEPDGDRLQMGTVRVRTEYYELPAQVLRQEVVVQTWYRSHDGWFLQWNGGNPVGGE